MCVSVVFARMYVCVPMTSGEQVGIFEEDFSCFPGINWYYVQIVTPPLPQNSLEGLRNAGHGEKVTEDV